jgi:hypothetical protein
VRLAERLFNQHDVLVQEGELTMLVRRRDAADTPPMTFTTGRSDD